MDILELAAKVAEKMGMVTLPDESGAYEEADTVGAWGRLYTFKADICQEALAYRALREMANEESLMFFDSDIAYMVLDGTEAIFQAYLEWER